MFVFINLTYQKSGFKRGGGMGYGHSGYTIYNTVHYAASILLTLMSTRATSNTPLESIKHGYKWIYIWSAKVTSGLCLSTRNVGSNLGFHPEYMSSHAMCAGGMMDLLHGGIYYDKIKILRQ